MELRQTIRSFSTQPLPHQVLLSLLKDYKRPNDKVHNLLREGVLTSIRKGLYIAGPAVATGKPEPFLLANHILGPSYVSLDTALSYHGLIPERVFETASVTTKTSREFHTPMGTFSYTRFPLPYYSFGIRRIQLGEDQFALVASPEKALADKLINTAGVTLRSSKSTTTWLLENLRLDVDGLKAFDTHTMLGWVQDAPKKDSLSMLIKTIGDL
jgi:hypothetical protein